MSLWHCYFYVTAGWSVYPGFIPEGDQIVSKTYRIRVEGENTQLRNYLARLHRKTLVYSKSEEMLRYAIRLLLHYFKFWDVPVPTRIIHYSAMPGVVCTIPTSQTSLTDLMNKADQALYQAKGAGRDRAILEELLTQPVQQLLD